MTKRQKVITTDFGLCYVDMTEWEIFVEDMPPFAKYQLKNTFWRGVVYGLIIGILIGLVLSFTTSVAVATPNSYEQQAFNRLNMERSKRGLSPLNHSGRLATVARGHSRHMIEKDYFSHVAPDGANLVTRLKKNGVVGWSSIGENLAGASTVATASDLWLKSAGHKRNMLDSNFNHVGIGVVEGGLYGLMFTMVLAENPKLGISPLVQKRIRNTKVKIGRLKGTKTRLVLAKRNGTLKPYQMKELRRRLCKLRRLRSYLYLLQNR